MSEGARRGIRSAQAGLVVHAVLALTKLVAGLLGNSDAVESTTDIFSSLIVWSGLRIASRAADTAARRHPFPTSVSSTPRENAVREHVSPFWVLINDFQVPMGEA
jgi:hypothetical protein